MSQRYLERAPRLGFGNTIRTVPAAGRFAHVLRIAVDDDAEVVVPDESLLITRSA